MRDLNHQLKKGKNNIRFEVMYAPVFAIVYRSIRSGNASSRFCILKVNFPFNVKFISLIFINCTFKLAKIYRCNLCSPADGCSGVLYGTAPFFSVKQIPSTDNDNRNSIKVNQFISLIGYLQSKVFLVRVLLVYTKREKEWLVATFSA